MMFSDHGHSLPWAELVVSLTANYKTMRQSHTVSVYYCISNKSCSREEKHVSSIKCYNAHRPCCLILLSPVGKFCLIFFSKAEREVDEKNYIVGSVYPLSYKRNLLTAYFEREKTC